MTNFARQGQLRLLPGRGIAWINPECQWQGSSKQSCGEIITPVEVFATFPVNFSRYVNVCDHHFIEYSQMLRRSGHGR